MGLKIKKISPESSKTLFVSLAPHLIDEGGHDHAYHSNMQTCVQNSGWEFIAYVSKCCKLALHENWFRRFSRRPSSMFKLVGDYFSCFWKLRKRRKIFFLESFSTKDLIAFTLNCLFFGSKRDAVWVLFRYDLSQLTWNGKFHIYCGKILQKKLRKNFVVLTDTELLQKHYKSFFSTIRLMPATPIVPDNLSTELSRKKDKICCWWPGVFRKEKGLKEIKYCALKMQKSSFELFVPKASQVPFANGVSDVLTKEEYASLMKKVDLILLPYDPIVYKMGTSGVFIEAVIAGKIPLVKDGSWLASELNKFDLLDLIIDWTRSDLLDVLYHVHTSNTVRRKLKQMQKVYTEFHSNASYGRLVKTLLSAHEI